MKGTVWTVFAAAIGSAVFLMSAVSAALPASPSGSTSAVNSVLTQTAPAAGLVLLIAGIGALLTVAFKL